MTGSADQNRGPAAIEPSDVRSTFAGTGLGWSAAGSAGHCQEAMGLAVEPILAVAHAVDHTVELAVEAPRVCQDPTFATTISSILDRPIEGAGDPAVGGPPARRRSRDRTGDGGDPAPKPSRARRPGRWRSPEQADRPDEPGRTSGPRHATSGLGPKAEPPTGRAPAEIAGLARRISEDGLAARAGWPPPPRRAVTESPSGPRAPAPAPAAGRAASESAPVRSDRDHPFLKIPTADHATGRHRDRVARRLGLVEIGDLAAWLDVIPVDGPTVDADHLARCLAPSPPATPADRFEPIGQPAIPDRPPMAADHAGRDAPDARPGTAADPPAPSRQGPAPVGPGQADATPLRRVSSHDEMPPLPDRERVAAAVPRGPDEDDPPAGPLTDRLSRPGDTEPGAIDRHELEQQMKSILDEAARRHGIEL